MQQGGRVGQPGGGASGEKTWYNVKLKSKYNIENKSLNKQLEENTLKVCLYPGVGDGQGSLVY